MGLRSQHWSAWNLCAHQAHAQWTQNYSPYSFTAILVTSAIQWQNELQSVGVNKSECVNTTLTASKTHYPAMGKKLCSIWFIFATDLEKRILADVRHQVRNDTFNSGVKPHCNGTCHRRHHHHYTIITVHNAQVTYAVMVLRINEDRFPKY
jgi:hypothetical protein